MWLVLIAFIGVFFAFSLLVGIYILVIIRNTTSVQIKKLESGIKDPSMIMTFELAKSRAAFNEMQMKMGKPIVVDPVGKK